jgi:hypothetical protein
MVELTCAQVRDESAEFALGILAQPQRGYVAAHLLRCEDCRRDADGFTEVAIRLVEIIPGTEPPLGFDRKLLGRVMPHRRRKSMVAAVMASVAACVLLAFATTLGIDDLGHPTRPAEVSAVLWEGARPVGSLSASGRPLWVSLTVHDMAVSGSVTCQLLGRNGTVVTLGTFDVVHGSGSWAAPDPAGVSGDRSGRLVEPNGRVIAAATFTPRS